MFILIPKYTTVKLNFLSRSDENVCNMRLQHKLFFLYDV